MCLSLLQRRPAAGGACVCKHFVTPFGTRACSTAKLVASLRVGKTPCPSPSAINCRECRRRCWTTPRNPLPAFHFHFLLGTDTLALTFSFVIFPPQTPMRCFTVLSNLPTSPEVSTNKRPTRLGQPARFCPRLLHSPHAEAACRSSNHHPTCSRTLGLGTSTPSWTKSRRNRATT